MKFDPNNLRILVLKKNLKKLLECRYLCNLKLKNALYEYVTYSRDKYLNYLFYKDISYINKKNNKINKILNELIVF